MRKNTHRAPLWRDVPDSQWSDWRWHQANRVRDLDTLEKIVSLSPSEHEACERATGKFPMAITPYYASLMDPEDPTCPVRQQAIPVIEELEVRADELEDPLGEESHMPVPGLTHRYPDRVLLYATHNCPVYCRHCNRKRKVGHPESAPSGAQLAEAINYVRGHSEVRDILVSGGDPLSFSDAKLSRLLGDLRDIEHLEIIRLATRNPVTLPQRITQELATSLRAFHPIFVSTHFNHEKECTPEAGQALERLADAGCVVNNQMVLLKGVNDDPEMVVRMNQWLLRHRCRPYYIFQCDPAEGIYHFRTSLEAGKQILKKLRGWTSGLASPHYVVDLPGGGGKVPVQPDFLETEKDGTYTFRNFQGDLYDYHEGDVNLISEPEPAKIEPCPTRLKVVP